MIKTVTTTRKYDDEGRLIEETVCETTTPDPAVPVVLPHFNTTPCLCGTSARCYVHYPLQSWEPQPYYPTWTCTTQASNVVPINAASAS